MYGQVWCILDRLLKEWGEMSFHWDHCKNNLLGFKKLRQTSLDFQKIFYKLPCWIAFNTELGYGLVISSLSHVMGPMLTTRLFLRSQTTKNPSTMKFKVETFNNFSFAHWVQNLMVALRKISEDFADGWNCGETSIPARLRGDHEAGR